MLRSEVDWFPRFIAYCEYYLPTVPEDEEGNLIQDKATLRCVAACDGWREVQTILDAYRETAFTDLVYTIMICAKIPPTKMHYNRMDHIIVRAFKINEQHYHEHPRQLAEWILRQIRR